MKTEITKNTTWFDKQAMKFEETRFAGMAILITAQSCWGSVATMFALKAENVVLLAICAAITMASNAAFIAQANAKWCLRIFYASIVTNLVILLITIY